MDGAGTCCREPVRHIGPRAAEDVQAVQNPGAAAGLLAGAVLTRMLDGVEPAIVDTIYHAAEHVSGIGRVTGVKARWLGTGCTPMR